MILNIKNTEVVLKNTFRSIILWEHAMKKAFAPSSTYEMMVYFYAVIVSSSDIDFTFDEFMSWIDENPTLVVEFMNWVAQTNKEQELVTDNKAKDGTEKKTNV